jgi:uncharacterized NAD(P)/FAD-binding protein YdhS
MSRLTRIAIVGAGFSGVATSIQLARQAEDYKISLTLFNPTEDFGTGIAYGKKAYGSFLNVPAGKMSIFFDIPNDFVDFCQNVDPQVDIKTYAMRQIYGQYLAARYQEIVKNNKKIDLSEVKDQVVALRRAGDHGAWKIETSSGLYYEFDNVIIATGYANPKWPIDVSHLPRDRVIDAWDFQKLAQIHNIDPIIILGSGLTAVDTILHLNQSFQKQEIILLSRRGLLPHMHQPRWSEPGSSNCEAILDLSGVSVSQTMHQLRCMIRDHQKRGLDWRDFLDDLRPFYPKLWRQFSDEQKRLFTKRLTTYWDIHRHRMAPAVGHQIERLKQSGTLTLVAGNLLRISKNPLGIQVDYRLRGSECVKSLNVAAIINCTGHNVSIDINHNALFNQMSGSGLIKANKNGLGLEVSPNYEIINEAGEPNLGLWYIGPMLKAQYWEATAVPELRLHAQILARKLLEKAPDQKITLRVSNLTHV